jgi:hypothetical protein
MAKPVARRRDVYPTPLERLFHFVRDLPSEIAVGCAARLAAVEVMVKCCAKRPGFYEVCRPTLHQAPPGIDFLNDGSGKRQNAECRVRKTHRSSFIIHPS